MARTKDCKGFLARQNALIGRFPMVGGRPLDEALDSGWGGWIDCYPTYFSWLCRDRYIGLVLELYGAKRVKGSLKVQKLAVIPERADVTPLIRNCYYCWGGSNAGFHSYGYTGLDNKWYEYSDSFGFGDGEFPWDRVPSGRYLFDGGRLAELDPRLKWCAYETYVQSGIGCLEYIRLYRRWPEACERLYKSGLYRSLTDKALAKLEADRGFASWVIRNRDVLKAGHMAYMTAYNAYRKNPDGDPMDYRRSLEYRIECGRQAAFRNKRVYRKALRFTTQERIAEYLQGHGIGSSSYGDYLVACDWLKLDFSDTKVLFPRDFRAMHDLYTAQYAEHRRAEELAKAKAKAERFAFLGGFAEDGFRVLVASSKSELIDEGAALGHCVGRMDYDRRQAEGRSVICFIRRSGDESTPYATAEVKVDGQLLKVSQCYGYKDSRVPEVDGFVKDWMEASNKAYRKVRKESA